MKAVQLKEHPGFTLMKQTDTQTFPFMKMPSWLFSDPRYSELSLDSILIYTFLLNRFQISRKNGWTNDSGEVFVIFPRKELAKELHICEQRVTTAFQQLVKAKLVWEKRCGRGDANQIYLARVEMRENCACECVPVSVESPEDSNSRTAESVVLGDNHDTQEPQDMSVQNRETHDSGVADVEVLEAQDLRPNYKENRKKKKIQKEVSQFVECAGAHETNGQDEEAELKVILDNCELSFFSPGTAHMFENAIAQLFYSESLRIGNATLPQSRVRKQLHWLNNMTLREAQSKLAANTEKPIRNSSAYTMTTIFNAITEIESDLMVDPYLNSLA